MQKIGAFRSVETCVQRSPADRRAKGVSPPRRQCVLKFTSKFSSRWAHAAPLAFGQTTRGDQTKKAPAPHIPAASPSHSLHPPLSQRPLSQPQEFRLPAPGNRCPRNRPNRSANSAQSSISENSLRITAVVFPKQSCCRNSPNSQNGMNQAFKAVSGLKSQRWSTGRLPTRVSLSPVFSPPTTLPASQSIRSDQKP